VVKRTESDITEFKDFHQILKSQLLNATAEYSAVRKGIQPTAELSTAELFSS
jgi:hypothetical protein